MTTTKKNIRRLIVIVAISGSLSASAEQNHLEPLPLANPEPILSSLLHEAAPRLWMITLCHFDVPKALILDEQVEYKETETGDYEVTNRQLFFRYSAFKKDPRRFPPVRGNPYHEINIDEDIERCGVLVDDEFATTIEEAWKCVLKETRYPKEHRLGLDGTTYVFHCDRYYGEIWSPDSGLTVTLIELGNKLSDLARSEEKDREVIKTQCLELAEKIINSRIK